MTTIIKSLAKVGGHVLFALSIHSSAFAELNRVDVSTSSGGSFDPDPSHGQSFHDLREGSSRQISSVVSGASHTYPDGSGYTASGGAGGIADYGVWVVSAGGAGMGYGGGGGTVDVRTFDNLNLTTPSISYGTGTALISLHFESKITNSVTPPSDSSDPYPGASSMVSFTLSSQDISFLFNIMHRSECDGTGNCFNTQYAEDTKGTNYSFGENYEVAVPIVFGDSNNFQFRLTGAASAGGNATANLSSTVYWEGMRVLSGEGIPMAFNVSATSGVNYLNNFASAVPEPEIYAMLSTGLGVIGVIARRKRIT
jgi:hypothetical protein